MMDTLRMTLADAAGYTVRVEAKHAPMAHHLARRSYTATGYGKRIPTPTMVKYRGRWRRVYCCIYSNVGTHYIGKLADSLFVS
jgi:hypothetical protein